MGDAVAPDAAEGEHPHAMADPLRLRQRRVAGWVVERLEEAHDLDVLEARRLLQVRLRRAGQVEPYVRRLDGAARVQLELEDAVAEGLDLGRVRVRVS